MLFEQTGNVLSIRPQRIEAEVRQTLISAEEAAAIGSTAVTTNVEGPQHGRVRPTIDEVQPRDPEVKWSDLPSPEDRLAAGRARWSSGDTSQSEANRMAWQQNNVRRIRNGYETFSPVRRLLGWYPHRYKS